MIWLLLACSKPPPAAVGTVSGRTWSAPELGLALEFPEGWALVTDPALFRADLPNTVLEVRLGELQGALTVTPVPPLFAGQTSSLDLLHQLSPALGVSGTDDAYRLARVPHCQGAVQRRFTGLDQVALALPGGLALLNTWGADPAPAVSLMCAAQVAP